MTDLWTSVAAYAALEAQIASSAGNRAKVLADAKLDGLALARLRAAWDVRFAQDRSIEEAYEAALEGPEQAPVPEPVPELRTSVIEETSPLAAPPAPSLEASRWAAHAPPAPPDLWALVPPGMQHFSSVRKTEMASNLPPGPALPFARSTGSQPPELVRPVEEQLHSGIARPPARLSGTALAVDVPRGPALPFARSTGAPSPALEQPDEKQPLPCVVRPPARLSGTALVSDVPQRPVTPFSQNVAPQASATEQLGASPDLTVDQYALLRAHLAVNGEGDQATWEQFGIMSTTDKHAIQAGFAAKFKRDPTMQTRFVELVPRLIAQLRREGSGQ